MGFAKVSWLCVLAAVSMTLVGCAQNEPTGDVAHRPPRPDAAGCPRAAGLEIPGVSRVVLRCLTAPGQVVASSAHGRPEIVNLWASWCGPCRKETALLERAHRRLGASVLFLGVDERDSDSAARSFLTAQRVSYPQASDPDGRVARAMRFVGVPDTIALDASGRVVYRHLGPMEDADMRRALALLGVRR